MAHWLEETGGAARSTFALLAHHWRGAGGGRQTGDKTRGRAVSDARIVRRIFEEMLTIGSPTQIAANLTLDGITTKAWTTQDGQTRAGTRIDKKYLHKLLRNRLQRLAERIGEACGPCATRVFTDSAPVLEVELAARSGLGWRGKHTLLLDRDAGSWFFLGEIYTDLELAADAPVTDHCGTCSACIDACPTQAIVAAGRLDARLCISYLTIELKSDIPEALRPLLGNRIYGCDDCQLACPWNRFSPLTVEPAFAPRHALDQATLLQLFAWDEAEFDTQLAGSAIRRIGHERWLRNIAVALGNAPSTPEVVAALAARAEHPSALVREHVAWALRRHGA